MSKSNELKFSIIIPTYNRNELLVKCLDALYHIKQKANINYEVIVTDDSIEGLAEEVTKEYNGFVKWCEGPHRGPAANRNNGARYANGEWLIFLDDDCIPSVNL